MKPARPLSFPQERLWFLHQLNPGDVAYHEPYAWRLSGRLDLQALKGALTELVRRHEVLRTVFRLQEGEPNQVVLADADVPYELRDVSAAKEPAINLDALVQAASVRSFDLTNGPLLRAVVFRFDPQDHVLLLICHHIVIDSWSLGTMCRELGVLYNARLSGACDQLPPPTVQYSEFAEWQRRTMQGEALERQLEYWRRELSGDIPILNLPARPRPAMPSGKGARYRFDLSPALTTALKSLARKEGGTLYIALLTGLQVLLHRYSGLEDFTLGTQIANRPRPEFETMVGLCANTLAIRADISGNPSVIELFRRVRDRALDAYEHQDLPFELVVSDLRPARDPGRNPLFEVVVVFENAPAEDLQLSGLSVHREAIGPGTAKFDLTLILEEAEGAVRGIWEYRTELFDAGSLERMTGHFQRLLTEMTADPKQAVSALPILTERERRTLLVEWNDTRRDFPRDKTVHQLFEDQVERTPNAVALADDNRVLTYRELNERANQMAHLLCDSGVQVREPVAVLLDRSVEYVVAVLGVLKAGGAYVPIDPQSPALRLKTILDDAGIRTVVSDGPDLLRRIEAQPQSNLNRAIQATDPCYIIYTSGSTGVPKGVEVRHRSVARLVFGNDYLPFNDSQTYLLLAPVQFDVSTLEIWGPLLHGSKLAVDSQRDFEIRRLHALIERHKVTCLWLTSALFNVVIDHQPDALRSIPHLVIGGEALSLSHVRRALDLLPKTQITNGYGPTESTTFATTFAVPRPLDEDVTSVPIGRPIGNTQIYILDSARQLVPIGVTGEIHIGGDGLAAGYLSDPNLTKAKFIDNPFEPGAILYRTGDRGRYRADGNIEFLGRGDHQVKVRGFRVELGEVEYHLKQHPDVRDALAVVHDTSHGDRTLTGYVTLRTAGAATPSLLQQFLVERLPSHCVPSTLLVLDALPLTPSGKVDRKALPGPGQSPPRPEHVTEGSPTENRLMSIWQEILGVSSVGMTDNFFDLGGDSLMATRIQSRVESEFGTRFRLSFLFQHPTIAELAHLLEGSLAPPGEL